MDIIIVTGMSGGGKSQTVRFLEDLGYYCVDNMPPKLMADFINLSINGGQELQRIAFVTDIRAGEFFRDIKASIHYVNSLKLNCKVLFLEASDEVLIRRYKETRREHPLAKGGDVAKGIKEEQEKLADIRKIADHVIDTGGMRTSELRKVISEIVTTDVKHKELTIVLSSFGFKTGIPLDADYVFDVRFIPNPFYLISMKKLTGNSKKVQDYVMKWPEAKEFVKKTFDLIEFLLPYHIKEGKSSMVIAIGCTGGQHRSVTIANKLYELLKAEGRRVFINHREL